MRWTDVSMPLGADTPRFPGDPKVEIVPLERIANGASYELSRLTLGTHTGTHIDPPRHFFPERAGADAVPLPALVGRAVVVAVPDDASEVGPALVDAVPPGAERVLFRTRNSARWERGAGFFPDFVALTAAAADRLLDRRVRLVGIDALSVEPVAAGEYPVHRALLGAGIAVVEGLLLAHVPPGACELICLPLRLRDGDGGPARAVVGRPE